MIKATELRIGNYVSNGYKQLNIEYWMLDTGMDGENVDYLPIEITHEILNKCNFTKDADGIIKISSCVYYLDNGVIQIAIGYAPIMNIKCSYLHRLQNLYFTLFDKELEINL